MEESKFNTFNILCKHEFMDIVKNNYEPLQKNQEKRDYVVNFIYNRFLGDYCTRDGKKVNDCSQNLANHIYRLTNEYFNDGFQLNLTMEYIKRASPSANTG